MRKITSRDSHVCVTELATLRHLYLFKDVGLPVKTRDTHEYHDTVVRVLRVMG